MNIICVNKAKAKRARDIDRLIVNARQMPVALPARLFKAWLENSRRYPRLVARRASIQGKYILEER